MDYNFVTKVIRMFDSSKMGYKDQVVQGVLKNISNHKLKGNSLKFNAFYALVQFAHLRWHSK